jgi:hypothetical protein
MNWPAHDARQQTRAFALALIFALALAAGTVVSGVLP